MDGVILVDKPAGQTSHDVVARGAPRRSACARRGHAGTLDPFATGLLLVLVGRATRIAALPDGAAEDLRDGRAARRGRRRPATPRARSRETGRVPPDPLRAADGRRPPAPARLQRGADRRRARLRARAARRGRSRSPSARCTVHRFEQRWREGDRAGFAIDCSSGTYVRCADRRPRRRLLRGAAAHGDRPVRRRATPTRRASLAARATRWRFLPARRRSTGDDARGARRTARPIAGERRTADGRGPARRRRRPDRVAEPRDGRRAEARRRLPRVKVTAPRPTSSRARGASPSAPSTACTSATAR